MNQNPQNTVGRVILTVLIVWVAAILCDRLGPHLWDLLLSLWTWISDKLVPIMTVSKGPAQ